jgi:uncharacterized protein (DUF1778 family)
MTAPTQTPAEQSEPISMDRETVLSERDAKRFLELLDRTSTWNSRLVQSVEAYRQATRGNPARPFNWPGRSRA